MALQSAAARCNSLTGKALFAVIVGFPNDRQRAGHHQWWSGRQIGRGSKQRAAASPHTDWDIDMKRTYQASKVRRARTHGFLVRMKTRGGRAVINARRAKGRKRLAV